MKKRLKKIYIRLVSIPYIWKERRKMLRIVTIAFTEKVSGRTSPCGLTFHTLPSLIKGKQEGQTKYSQTW